FISRLKIFSGKLKTRWSGPFTITQVFPYGNIELSQPNGLNFKVNGHRVKHYFGSDIPSNVASDLHTLEHFVEIPSGEIKVHIEVLSVLWGNRLPIQTVCCRCLDFEERFSTLRNWFPSITNKLDMIGLEKLARVHIPGEDCAKNFKKQSKPDNIGYGIERLHQNLDQRRSNKRRIPNIVKPDIRTIEEFIPMADRTMEELLQDAARIWYEKEPPNSILTWDDLVNKLVNQFFPPSKTTHLKNEISHFTQRFEETFGEAWDRFKEMLRACPHYGFSELT
nr:reverse transcriptase domain-containing protein [Tanacetum cinerariifolium]